MTDVAPAAAGLGYLRALYPDGPPPGLRVLRLDRGEGTDWRQVVGEGGECHLIWGTASLLPRAWRLARFTRQLSRRRFFWQLIGLHGAVENPSVVALLRRNILQYIYTEAFRGTDSPLRTVLKRCASSLPPALTWQGPLVLIASPNPVAFDRFVLFTDDREIAFLFRSGETAPWAVCKRGDPESLASERRHHERALQLLGDSVPALLNSADNELLIQEALPEHFLGNIVAGAWCNRRAVFVREALAHVAFCLEVYRRFIQGAPPVVEPVTAAEVDDLLAALADVPCEVAERECLGSALRECVGAALPRLIQHGDFCVRNVLIAGGERGRVLIDWEDLRERRFPLADFALLRVSLKEAYAALFKADPEAMYPRPELARELTEAEAELGRLLGLDRRDLKRATLLSLACLCRQNLNKKRDPTARSIFAELLHIRRT